RFVRERNVVADSFLGCALEHAAVDQDLGLIGLEQVLGTGHGLGRAQESKSQWHDSIVGRIEGTLAAMEQRIEPGPGQESGWEYPRPPRVESVPERIRVVVGGVDIANSTSALRVLETAGPPVYYLPPTDIRMEFLTPTDHRSHCEWKGEASYYSLR